MISSISTLDGALGFGASADPNFIIAPAPQGSTTVPATFGDSSYYDVYGDSKLCDRAAVAQARGVSPLRLLRMASSTAGSIGAVSKDPATEAGVPFQFYGGIRLAGADENGNVFFRALDPDATLTVVNGGANGYAATGKDVTLTVKNDATGTQIAALALGAAAGILATPVALGTGASVVGQTLAKTAFGKGGLVLTPLKQGVRFKTAVAGGNGASLAVGIANGTDDITITLGTDGNGQPDPTKNTGTLVKAALDANAAAQVSTALAGDGTGHVGQQTSFQALQYGSTGAVAASGTPIDHAALRVTIVRAGGVGVGAFTVSTDDLPTPGPVTTIPGGGTYAVPGLGVTLTFSGTFDLGDVFTSTVVGPTSTAGDLLAALAVLSGLSDVDGGEAHILGGITGAMAALITTWLAQERAAGRDWIVYAETRDYNGGESKTDYVTALRSDFASVLEPVGALEVVPGWWETVVPNQGIFRRSNAWNMVTQVWSLPYWVHPVSKRDGGGAVPGFYTPVGGSTPNTHDERLTPGLGGSNGRFMTMQSFPGVPGQWYIGDSTGKRSPGTMAAGTSDWSLLMYARLGNRARRFLQKFALELLGRFLDTKEDGRLTGGELMGLQADTESALGAALKGAVQSVEVTFSATEITKDTKRIPYLAKLKTYAYVLDVAGSITQAL